MIPKLVMQDTNLPIIAKVIYAYFCSYTGAGNTCFPSKKKICFDLQINPSTYKKYTKVLVENGYLKVEQIRENDKFARNLYTLVDTIAPQSKKQVYEPENGDFTAISPWVISPTSTAYTTKSNIDKINKHISLSKKVSKASDAIFSQKIEIKKTPVGAKENKVKKETEKKKPISFDELIDNHTDNVDLRKELGEHLKTRKLKKAAFSNRAIELSLKKLGQLASSDEEKILIVQNSIMNGWTTFNPLKSDEKKQLHNHSTYDLNDYLKTMDTVDEYDGRYGTVIT